MADELSPTTRLFNTLLVTFLAIFLGLFAVRLKYFVPEDGHVKAMGFFTGQIAFPLLIFKTVATAELGAVDLGIIGACTLGKVTVMLLTWLLAYSAYQTHRDRGQRVLTATVFAFYAVASNDFALGFPVIEALYGKELDMTVYIAGNALVGSFLFVPLSIVMFTFGQALRGQEDHRATSQDQGRPSVFRKILKDLMQNPVISMTIVGLLFKVLLGHTLVHESGNVMLPHPLSDAIELVTSPFTMSALFLTGTSLRSAKIAFWPSLLVLMKVVVCSYVSYGFGSLLVGQHDASLATTLKNFAFFYGAIPASSAPIVFASQFDPSSAELLATAVLFGMILAGPIMFITALLLNISSDMHSTLANVQLSSDTVSLVCGVLFLLAILLLRARWGFQCPTKQLVFWYGVTLTIYAAVSIAINPHVNASTCEEYNEHSQSGRVIIFAWLQSSAAVMLLVLHYMYAYGPKTSPHRPLMGLGVAAACCAVGLLPAFFADPNTNNEVCEHTSTELRIRLNVLWSLLKFLVVAALGAVGIVRQGNLSKNPDSESAFACPGTEDTNTDISNDWYSITPHSLLLSLVTLNAVKILTQVVNAALVSFEMPMDSGSFAAMLMLETTMEHGQMIVLFVSLFFSEYFTALFSSMLPWICPFSQNSKGAHDTVATLDPFELRTHAGSMIEDP